MGLTTKCVHISMIMYEVTIITTSIEGCPYDIYVYMYTYIYHIRSSGFTWRDIVRFQQELKQLESCGSSS
jgi:hypothetical protein